MANKVNVSKKEEPLIDEGVMNEVYNFQYGLPGFEYFTEFTFEPIEEYPPFVLFKSVVDENISMYVLNAKYFQVYDELDIPKAELDKLELKDSKELGIYFILRLDKVSQNFMANLKTPLIINKDKKIGNQIFLEQENLEKNMYLNDALKE